MAKSRPFELLGGSRNGEAVLIDQNFRQLQLDFDVAESEAPKELLGLLSPDDIYRYAEKLVEHLKEDRRIERKPTGMHARPLGEYFAMWANTSPDGGIIAFGLTDEGEVIGCEGAEQTHVNRIENAGSDFAP